MADPKVALDPRTLGPPVLSGPASRWPGTVWGLHLVLWLVGLLLLRQAPAGHLEELLPLDTQADLRVLKEDLPFPDDLFLFVRGGSAKTREVFLDELDAQLAGRPEYFPDRLFRLDLRPIQPYLLLYLKEDQVNGLAGLMRSMQPQFERGGSLLGWASVPSGKQPEGLQAFYFKQLQASLRSRGRAPWQNPLDNLLSKEEADLIRPFWNGQPVRYLTLENETHLMLVRPANDQAVAEIRKILHDVAGRHPEIDVELTGSLAVVGEQRRAATQELGLVLGALGCTLFFASLLGLVPLRRLLLASVSVTAGFAASCGAGAYLLGLGPIWLTAQALVGLLAGYQALHYAVDRDLRHVFRLGVVSVSGFLAMALIPLAPPAQLGGACALGTALCTLCLLLAVPASDQLGWIPPDRSATSFLDRSWPGRRPTRAILAVTAILALACLTLARKNRFSADPLAPLDASAPSLRTERELQNHGKTSLFALVVAPDSARASAVCEALESLPHVGETLCLAKFLPREPGPAKARAIESIARVARAARLPTAIPVETAEDLRKLGEAFPPRPGEPDLAAGLGPGGIQDALRSFQMHLLEDLKHLFRLMADQKGQAFPMKLLPSGLQQRLLSQKGHVAVLVFPKVGKEQNLEAFVAELRHSAARVGGPAVMAADLAWLTRRSLRMVPWALAMGMVVGLTLVLRSPWRAALVVAGPSLAVLFTQTSLAFYRVPLNFLTWPAPVVVLLLGVSTAIGTLRRPRASLRALGPAVCTLAVSLVMMWSVHPGLAGLGLVMSLGMGFNLLIAVVVLPAAQSFIRALSGRKL
ncbi:MAG: hypothetical protein KF760_07470 [Candidatus Eremiobacteraeota bacterium]|nr:hypothetical protein [Candidatus Eremiobacteraeota bacterium]MCW5869757.1 hypothetical protein [Candidatus Eremiobacteraeota bacterium]